VTQVKPYKILVPVYNHLMRNIDYEAWGEYIALLTKDYYKKNPDVLEIASGNLKLAKYLRRNYFRKIVVSDLSLEMLKYHKSKSPGVCFDMCFIPFKKSFDIVFSSFDSVNYLLTQKAFIQMLEQVSSVLKKDGVFLFDVSLERNSHKYLKLYRKNGSHSGISYNHESSFDNVSRIHKQKFTFVLRDGKKYIETHKQKIFKFEDYFKMIDKSPFYTAECYKAFTFSNAKPDTERAQFILKRKKDAFF